MFDAIRDVIDVVVEDVVDEGGAYLDKIEVSVPSKGVDSHHRSFFCIPMEVTIEVTTNDGRVDTDEPERGTVIFFQRYEDKYDVWVTGGLACGLCLGSIRPGCHEDFIIETLFLVLAGDTVTVEVPREVHGWKRMISTLRLLQPEEDRFI